MEAEIRSAAFLGEMIRRRRQELGLRQPDLALVANVGIRFIVDAENGKESCQIGLVLRLLKALGIRVMADLPLSPTAAADGSMDLDIDDETPQP